MKSVADTEETRRTSTLLSELDDALDQSSLLRQIFNAYQRLHGIESITGPSHQTRKLREEIQRLEDRLREARIRSGRQRQDKPGA